MVYICSMALFTYRESRSGKNHNLSQCVRVCSSGTTELADPCDLFGNNAFGIKAVSLFTVVRQSI